MNEEQVSIAKREKKFYLGTFYLVIFASLLSIPVLYAMPDNSIIKYIYLSLGIAIVLSEIVVTWRLCRALQINKIYSVLNTIISFFAFLLQAFFLIYLYSKKTGVGIGFTMRNRNDTSSRKRFLIPIILLGFPLTIYYALIFYAHFSPPDLKQVDEQKLGYTHVSIPHSQNAFFDLEKSSASLSVTKEQSDLIKKHIEGKTWNDSFVKEILIKNSVAISHFLNACQKNKFQDPQVLNQIKDSNVPYASYMVPVSQLAALRSLSLWKQGHQEEGIKILFGICDLASTIQHSQVSLIHYAVSLAMTKVGLMTMNQCLLEKRAEPGLLLKVIHYLNRLDIGLIGLKSAYAIEYRSLTSLIFKGRLASWDDPKRKIDRFISGSPTFQNFLYQPNRTKQYFADYFVEIIDELDRPFIDVGHYSAESLLKGFSLLNPDNIIGKIILSVGLPRFAINKKTFATRALLFQTKINFSLHAYKIEKGNNPDSLSRLVPRYMEEVPLDPFNGEPMKYSKEKGIIYSVGENLTDTGGSEGKDWFKMDDPTIKISY